MDKKKKIGILATIASGCIALSGLIILVVGFAYITKEVTYASGIVHIIVGSILLALFGVTFIVLLIVFLCKRKVE